MFDQWSNNIDKSNIKYYDVIIKWLNITTLRVNMYKRHALYYDIVTKCLNIITLKVNIDMTTNSSYTSRYTITSFVYSIILCITTIHW